MAEQKKNDWLATLFFSPDKTPQDLANLGITTDNSSLQDIEYYKKIPQIQEAFKNESGNFDNVKFDKYYSEILKLYNDADNAKLESDITDFYTYDPYDYFASADGKLRNVAPRITMFPNTQRKSSGLTNLHETSAPTMSTREVGQMNKVFNWDTQKFENWTPNDWGGLSAISRPTLVLATWDEDGEHEVDGRIISHKKGDLKFNSLGDTYYETLGNRSIAGKDVLHIADTLSIDGSKWNKYDFFDSDGLDKSVGGTIAKTFFKVAPMFIPGVGKYYGRLTAAIELGKLLPVLYKSIEGIATDNISTSRSAQTVNDIQAWFSRFDGSVSDMGQQGFFNMENIGKLIEDSSMQLFQQREIGNLAVKLFSKGKNASENAIKWGRGLSLAYMAGTSSTEAYDAFKEAGASDRVAGLGMLSVTGAMFGLMNNDYFKDLWFRNTILDKSKLRSIIKESAKQINDKEFVSAIKETATPKGAAKWVMKTKDYFTNKFSSMNPGDLFYDSLNEGLEETIEEVSTDAVKGFYSGLNALGLVDNGRSYNFGFTPEDMMSRYLTSFVGGSIGGAVFSVHNKWESRHNPTINDAIKGGGDGLKEIVYLLRSGKEQALRTELDRLHKAGKLGSTNLSGTEFEIVKDGDEHVVQYKPADTGKSQNDLIYQQLNYYIDRINEIVKEEGLDLSDNELQYITQMSEATGQTIEQIKEGYMLAKKADREKTISEQIVNSGLYSQLFNDWNNITSQIVQTKVELEQLLTPSDTESKTPKDIDEKINAMKNNSEYQRLRLKLDNLRAERNAIINGEKNDFYTGQLLFAANPELVNNFVSGFGIHNYTKFKYGKNYDTLTADEKTKVDADYLQYTTSTEKAKVLLAYNIFSKLQEETIASINDIGQKIKDSSGIYMPETTEYKLLYENTQELIKRKKESLNELLQGLPEGITTNDEIEKLRLDISELEKYSEALSNYKFGVLNPALSKEGKNILVRPEMNDKSFFALITYAQSYKDYLNYIKNNNLYLDAVDSDLASIFHGLLDVNDLGDNNIEHWKSKITKYLNDNDINSVTEDFINNVASELANIISYIKNNDLNGAITAYKNATMSDLVDEAEDYGTNINIIFDSLLPTINEETFIEYLTDIQTLKSQISSSPAYDLIKTVSKIINTDNEEIVSLIKAEETNLLNSKSVEDYIIRDKNALRKLQETIKIINAISALLDASVENGFNSQINPYRQRLQKELLPIISVEGVVNIAKELNRIATQLQTLIDISERNQSQKLREQKDIAINMRSKFTKILTSKEPEDSLAKENFAKAFDIDLDKLTASIEIPSEITEENYKEFEEKADKLETEIYKHIISLNLSAEEIANRLVGLFNPLELINGKPTKLSRNIDTKITDYDKLIYLATIISTPSQNFYSKLKEVISNPEFKNAPIFSQEYAVRVAYSQILNKEIFNNIVLNIRRVAQLTSKDEYIKTKSPLNNIIAIYGGAGVGKTKGVAYLLKLMIPDAIYVTSAPTKMQTDNLSNSIKHTGTSFTKNELIEKILGRPIQESDIKSVGDISVTSDISLKVKSNNLFGDSNTKILFIDEISWYNRIELELISKWAKQNNVSIVALGDYKQNSSFVMFNNKLLDCGIEDTFLIKTPNLIAPLRPDNIAKYDNYVKLSTILDELYDHYYNDTSISPNVLNDFAKQYLDSNKLVFKYFETENTFGGEKIIQKGEVQYYIDKFKKLSDNIAIITDNPQKYNTIKDNSIKIVPLNSVQGNEYDYVIIDKNFGLDNSRKGRGEFYKLKDLYTLSQRSKKGTVIVNSGLSTSISSKLDQTSAGNIEMPQSQIDDFKNWRINLLDNITSDIVPFEPIQGLNIPIAEEEQSIIQNTNIQTTELIPEESKISTELPERQPSISIETSTTNAINQESYNEIPIAVVNDNDSSKVEQSIVETNNNVSSPNININQSVGTALDFAKFINDNLYDYYEDKGFLGIKSPDTILSITNLLRSYFINGYYKTGTKELDAKHTKGKSRLLHLLRDILINNPSIYKQLREAIESYEFIIIPYDQQKLLVARINNVDIPLLIVNAPLGKYIGDIEIASKLNYVNDAPNIYELKLSEFIDSNINTNKAFNVYDETIVFSADKEELETFDDSQKERAKSFNGRSFIIVSSDLLLDSNDFRKFLKPTIIDNKVAWTTQHNDTITLIGANWVVDLETILNASKLHANNKNADSIINGQRAGDIIGIAYKIAPDIVSQRIRYYLNNNNKVSINGELVTDVNLVDEILNKHKDEDLSIMFGFIDPQKGRFIPDVKGEWSINKIFGKLKNQQNLSQSQIISIERACNESPKFKQGIYGRDIRRETINGVYRRTDQKEKYVTNVKYLIGNDYKIDSSKVIPVDGTPKSDVISKLNLQLAELGWDNKIISNEQSIESTMQSINNEIISSITSPEFEILEFDGNNIVTVKKNDIRYMIANKLNISINNIEIFNTESSIFVPFSVSLQSQTSNYVAENKNGEWVINDFNTVEEYTKLYEVFQKNRELILKNDNIAKYVSALIENQEINQETAKDYYESVAIDPIYNELQQSIDNYLISKLINNEC